MAKKDSIGRRNFLLKGGATLLGAGAALGPGGAAQAQNQTAQNPAAPPAPTATPPKGAPRPNERVETLPPAEDPVNQSSGGADFMLDVIKSLGLEFIATNPAASFRGLHEAIINYGDNKSPELLTCTHEEIAVAMAQGYAKIEGKPMGVLVHGTVGLQHASMAIYNAFCDRIPVYLMAGNILDAEKRAPLVEWMHSAQDPAALVRDFVKWDDQPRSLQHFAESAVRAYKLATTPPMAPVFLSLDAELQEGPIEAGAHPRVPKLPRTVFPQADAGAVEELARMLVAASNPLLIVDRMARTQAGMDRLVELAELLQCAVIDQNGRTNFPAPHPLNQTFNRLAVLEAADLIVGIELSDFWGATHGFKERIVRRSRDLFRPGTKLVSIGVRDLFIKSNYQDFQRFADVDIAITADGEAMLPQLIEAVRRLVDAGRKSAFAARGKKLREAYEGTRKKALANATIGWDSSPITLARLCAELWNQIQKEDWSLVGNGIRVDWHRRLWNIDKIYRLNGYSGGYGIGYTAPGALGAALANRKHGRLSVSIQGDGDLMMAPGTLWTAAHHRIPILYVMHNNRSYHQEQMYLQSMANRRSRGVERSHIGTALSDPHIDFATVAKGMGVYAEGPITDPKDLGPALKRAIAVVKRGQPALIDTVVEPR